MLKLREYSIPVWVQPPEVFARRGNIVGVMWSKLYPPDRCTVCVAWNKLKNIHKYSFLLFLQNCLVWKAFIGKIRLVLPTEKKRLGRARTKATKIPCWPCRNKVYEKIGKIFASAFINGASEENLEDIVALVDPHSSNSYYSSVVFEMNWLLPQNKMVVLVSSFHLLMNCWTRFCFRFQWIMSNLFTRLSGFLSCSAVFSWWQWTRLHWLLQWARTTTYVSDGSNNGFSRYDIIWACHTTWKRGITKNDSDVGTTGSPSLAS